MDMLLKMYPLVTPIVIAVAYFTGVPKDILYFLGFTTIVALLYYLLLVLVDVVVVIRNVTDYDRKYEQKDGS